MRKLPTTSIKPTEMVSGEPDEVIEPVETEAEPEPVVKPLDSVMIELPLLPIEGYVRKRVDVTFTSAEAHALKAVRNALEAKSATLSNGKNVTTVSDAVRWIVQQIMV